MCLILGFLFYKSYRFLGVWFVMWVSELGETRGKGEDWGKVICIFLFEEGVII